jgi:hypothetical protein
MRANAVGLFLLLLAVAGTSAAGERWITGARVANGSITGADVRVHGLRSRDLAIGGFRGRSGPRGRRGPSGPAGQSGGYLAGGTYLTRDLVVARDGTAANGSVAAHPAPGVYCVSSGGLYAQATSLEVDSPMIIAADSYPRGQAPAPPCEQGTGTRVSVFAPDGTPADGAFQLVFSSF